jgi:hypothetical protein
MADEKLNENPWPQLDPSMMTRLEALKAALEAGTSPQPTREFSTLVEGSERSGGTLQWAPEASDCADERACLVHGVDQGHVAISAEREAGLERLLDALQTSAGPLPSVRAGSTDGDQNEVQNEQGAIPDPSAAHEEY